MKKLICFIIVPFLFLSCPNPITEDMVNFAKDEIAPVILILSPSDNGTYQSNVTVVGSIIDYSTSDNDIGKVTSASYESMGTQTGSRITN